jgi:hypothetical protein
MTYGRRGGKQWKGDAWKDTCEGLKPESLIFGI